MLHISKVLPYKSSVIKTEPFSYFTHTHISMFEFVVVVVRYYVDVSRAFLIFKHQSHVQIEIMGHYLHVNNVILQGEKQ